ncbi:hypothetical protein ACFVVM_03730 [Nocardia sp. NPDC058176]|uniref:hypothetical protein n=1 Tax=Nocardia sp. NPDC058176 TaxID=3346368 RepID=UPI0036DFA291
MSAAERQHAAMERAQRDRDRLDVVRGVLADMHEAAWESMERDDFAATETEWRKLAEVDKVRPSVEADHAVATARWQAAAAPVEPVVRVEARLAPQRRVIGARPRSRGIERSR